MTTIDGKTKTQSIRDIDRVVAAAYRTLQRAETPYCATIADAMRAAAVAAIEAKYKEATDAAPKA